MIKKAHTSCLSIEKLTELSIERSKLWSKVLQGFSEEQDDREIKLDDIEYELEGDGDIVSDNDLAEMESDDANDEEGQEIIKELTKCVQQGRNLTASSFSETLSHHSFNDHTRNKIQTILDETLPVLAAYDRNCKESGMEKVLNTFDIRKINESKSGFLRHINHNIIEDFDNISPIAKQRKYKMNGNRQDESSTDDSMQSDDTARYIRSSRNKHRSKASMYCTPRSPTNTMTIKTYRLVKSKRDALREKYACSDEEKVECADNEFEENCQRRLRRQQLRKKMLTMSAGPHRRRYHHHDYDHDHVQRHNILQSNGNLHESERIKRIRNVHLLPGHHQAMNTSDEQSDDENVHYLKPTYMPYGSCSTTKKHKMTARRFNYYTPCSCSNCTRNSMPLHCNSARSVRTSSSRMGRFQLPKIREVMRESECSCCGDDTLCSNSVHLADLSTGEWVVENIDSPKKFKLKHSSRVPPTCKNKKYDNLKRYKRNNNLQRAFDETPLNHMFGKSSKKSIDVSGIHPLSSTAISTKIPLKRQSGESSAKICHDKHEEVDNSFKQLSKMSTGNKKHTKEEVAEEVLSTAIIRKRHRSNNGETCSEEPVMKLKSMEIVQKNTSIKKNKRQSTEQGGEEESKSFLKDLSLAIKESKKLYEKEYKTYEKERKKKKPTDKDKIESVKKVKNNKKCMKMLTNDDRATSTKEKSKEEQEENQTIHLIDSSCESVHSGTVIKVTRKVPSIGKEIAPVNKCAESKNDKINNSFEKEKNTNISLSKTENQHISGEILIQLPEAIKSPKQNDANCKTPVTDSMSLKAKSPQNIVIYNSSMRKLLPSECLENGQFVLTKEHLGKFVGQEMSSKFFKYYVGRRKFDLNSTVQFCPPKSSDSNNNDETESDDDELELFGKYGHLRVSIK